MADNVSGHGGAYGTYHVEAWVTLGNGMIAQAGTATDEIRPLNTVTRTDHQDDGTVRVVMAGPDPTDEAFRITA